MFIKTRFFNDELIGIFSASVNGMPGPLQAVYYASKAYVTSFSNALSEELSNTDVTVTVLLPGATETEFAITSGMDKTELFTKTEKPHKIALAGYTAMMQGKLDIVAGLTTMQKIMIATIPLLPKKMMLKQVRKMQEINK